MSADPTTTDPQRTTFECDCCGGRVDEEGNAEDGWPFEWQVASALRTQLAEQATQLREAQDVQAENLRFAGDRAKDVIRLETQLAQRDRELREAQERIEEQSRIIHQQNEERGRIVAEGLRNYDQAQVKAAAAIVVAEQMTAERDAAKSVLDTWAEQAGMYHRERDEAQAQVAAQEGVIRDYEGWIADACAALGVTTVFEFKAAGEKVAALVGALKDAHELLNSIEWNTDADVDFVDGIPRLIDSLQPQTEGPPQADTAPREGSDG